MAGSTATAEDDPLHTGHTHDGEVGKFYQTWLSPISRKPSGERIQSCCGGQECRPILEIRPNKKGTVDLITRVDPSSWEVLVNVPYDNFPKWLAVSDRLWEDMQPDPRESPDNRGHACVTFSGHVLCAVRAPGL